MEKLAPVGSERSLEEGLGDLCESTAEGEVARWWSIPRVEQAPQSLMRHGTIASAGVSDPRRACDASATLLVDCSDRPCGLVASRACHGISALMEKDKTRLRRRRLRS